MPSLDLSNSILIMAIRFCSLVVLQNVLVGVFIIVLVIIFSIVLVVVFIIVQWSAVVGTFGLVQIVSHWGWCVEYNAEK